MNYDEKHFRMREALFLGRPSSRWAPINVLNYFLNRHVIEALALRPSDGVLEVGCDRGQFLAVLKPLCNRVVGIDVNATALAHCEGVEVSAQSASKLSFFDGSFDRVVSCHTIEHIVDLDDALREMGRVLKPGGRMVHVYPLEPIRGYSAVPGALWTYHSLRTARELHVHALTPKSLSERAARVGLRHVHSKRVFTPIPLFPAYLSVFEHQTSAASATETG